MLARLLARPGLQLVCPVRASDDAARRRADGRRARTAVDRARRPDSPSGCTPVGVRPRAPARRRAAARRGHARPPLRGERALRPAARRCARGRTSPSTAVVARPRAARAAAASASCTSRPRTSPARTAGRSARRELDVGQEFRNTYERTKFEAEGLLRESADGPAAHRRPPEHRRRRGGDRLDDELQRHLPDAARLPPRARARAAGRRRTRRRRRDRRLRGRRARAPRCSTTRSRRAPTTSSRAPPRRRSRCCATSPRPRSGCRRSRSWTRAGEPGPADALDRLPRRPLPLRRPRGAGAAAPGRDHADVDRRGARRGALVRRARGLGPAPDRPRRGGEGGAA